ncbi:MAG: threonine synthase [Gammaproteobacteria bacterium]
MRYTSTRESKNHTSVGFESAIAQGLARDGGLYVPEVLPDFDCVESGTKVEPADVAYRLLKPFVRDSRIADHLEEICRTSFNFPLVQTGLDTGHQLSVLELFHGPTAAFKDIGAGFLAGCLAHCQGKALRTTILVATSGDTGAAVAAAFHGRKDIDVVILYPRGLVSPRQAHQLSCWGDNVRTYEVNGTFDDCQRLVKGAFVDPEIIGQQNLCSANSINIGRLLPQMVYYASAALGHYRESGKKPGFVIPTGNLGNAFAGILARRLGWPIGDIVLATNANRPVPDFLETGRWEPRPSIATLASAMDVGNPSNMERLRWLYPDAADLSQFVSAVSASDEDIATAIRYGFEQWGAHWCPHSATAYHAWNSLSDRKKKQPWLLLATAHAAKFDVIVEPLIGDQVSLPETLSRLMERPACRESIAAEPEALRKVLMDL